MRIITDSAADFTPEELDEYKVHCVPTQVIFGQECCIPGVDLSCEAFWQRMVAGERPTTSQPSPAAFLDAFSAARADDDDGAICICVSSGVSGTYQSARLAASMCDWDQLHVIDSLTGTAGQKLLVLEACRLRDAGYATKEIVQEISRLRSRVRLCAGLDTLEYLARSGRIPKALASLGSLARLKPLVEVSPEGRIGLCAKAFGRLRAIETLAQRIARQVIDPEHPILPLYSHDDGNCRLLLDKLAALGVRSTAPLCAIGPSIGPHIGPGVFGAAFVVKAEG
nr:DegV family protein [Clostridia bacterium]